MAEKIQSADPNSFPWHLGVYDAHCHPTDTMSSVKSIKNMKARALTVMATRAEDQELVSQVADELGITDLSQTKTGDNSDRKVVPCFGWHPWFSHQLYDDLSREPEPTHTAGRTAWKHAHYQKVLTPKPEDHAFLDSLPDPHPLSQLIQQLRGLLERYPLALVGEIGLDKTFRVPDAWTPDRSDSRNASLTPGGREGRRLSPYRVSMAHQKMVLMNQLRLAGEMQRAVSVHGVQAHGVLFDVLQETWKGFENRVVSKRVKKRRGSAAKAHENEIDDDEMARPQKRNEDQKETIKPFPPRICLHSYSGPPDTLKQYLDPVVPAEIFFSFSSVISFSSSSSSKTTEVIEQLPDGCLLVESDLHCAGERMDEDLECITGLVCHFRGWSKHDGIQRLGANWRRFVFGRDG